MKRRMQTLFAGTIALLLIGSGPVQAQTIGSAEGEIRRIDKEAGKITIRHGPIAELDMPAMSMVFRPVDPALLDQLKTGDKVRFTTRHENGTYFLLDATPQK